MNGCITLWDPRADMSTDDAGTTILKYSCSSRANIQAPYDRENPDKRVLYVPSLQSLCIKRLVDFPEQIHHMGSTQLLYEPPEAPGDRDLLRELIPDYPNGIDPGDWAFLKTVDPRLWAVLIQVYAGLPDTLTTYYLPLADRHLPLLQQIPSTSDFSLVTIVDLRAYPDLNDQTIIRLRDLHGLGALDISDTKVTSWGIKSLAKTMVKSDSYACSDIRHLAGPWKLRILCLRDCKQVEDDVFEGLRRFPLLSVIDLRGTRCTSSANKGSAFASSTNQRLFFPTPLRSSLNALCETLNISHSQLNQDTPQSQPQLFSHDPTFYLHVRTQFHEEKARYRASSSRSVPSGLKQDIASTPLGGIPNTLGHIASIEARRHASSASVLSFYAAPTPRGARSSSSAALQGAIPDKSDDNTSEALSSPLTLYRPPPPWHTLFSPPPMTTSHKRPRTSTDESLPPPKRAKGAVEGLLSRDGAIMIRSEFQKDREERKKVAPKPNPFKKGMPVSVFEEERRKAVSANAAAASRMAKPAFGTLTSTTPRSTIPASATTKAPAAKTTTPLSTVTSAPRRTDRTKPKTLAEKFPDNLCQPSILPIPPRPNVPLFPISSLPIPQLPPEILAKMRAEAAASKRKAAAVSQPSVQTKLSDFVKRKPASNSAGSSSARGSSSSAQSSGERLKPKPGKPIPAERRSASSSIQKGPTGRMTNSLWPKSRSAGPVASSSKAGRGASGVPSTKTGS